MGVECSWTYCDQVTSWNWSNCSPVRITWYDMQMLRFAAPQTIDRRICVESFTVKQSECVSLVRRTISSILSGLEACEIWMRTTHMPIILPFTCERSPYEIPTPFNQLKRESHILYINMQFLSFSYHHVESLFWFSIVLFSASEMRKRSHWPYSTDIREVCNKYTSHTSHTSMQIDIHRCIANISVNSILISLRNLWLSCLHGNVKENNGFLQNCYS